MFEITKMLGRLGEVKEQVKVIKAELAEHRLTHEDADSDITVEINGNKEIKRIALGEKARALPHAEQEASLVNAVNAAINDARVYAKAELQKRLAEEFPSIAGLDLSKYLD